MKKVMFLSALILISCSKGDESQEEELTVPPINMNIQVYSEFDGEKTYACESARFIKEDGTTGDWIYNVEFGDEYRIKVETNEENPYVNGFFVRDTDGNSIPDNLPRNQKEVTAINNFVKDVIIYATCSDTYYP